MTDTNLRFIYITCADAAQAEKIARALVEERLAACANILPGVRSIYRWKGNIEEAEEVALIAKTRAGLVDALTERVKALHSYEVPCIVALPITGGNREFLAWIEEETG
ncbi:MAG TPA: divalent-cation tolerance protein CutA [bacterium]|nr:divalent-cation tolerance protein CutA [bacterium]